MNIPENFDRWMFDYNEGNLSGAEKEAFENFLIQNPDFEIEADAWNNSFIQNEEFVYPNADALEKDRKVAAGWYGWSAAAVALILIGTSIWFFNNDSATAVEGMNVSTDLINNSQNPLSHNSIDQSDLVQPRLDENVDLETGNDGNVANGIVGNIINGHSGVSGLAINNGSNHSQNGNNGSTGIDLSNSSNHASSNTFDQNTVDNIVATDPTLSKFAMNQELSKFDEDGHTAVYLGNPEGKQLAFDVAKNEKFNMKSWQNKVKSIYRKIERMFDNPVGLTNLRDPEIMLPNNSVVGFNPAFTGGMLSPRFDMNYRNQWFGDDQNSQQLTMAFDNYVYAMRGGIGVMVNAKDYGLGQFNDYNVSLTYSPKILLSKDVVFEPAVKMTMGTLQVNGDKISPDSDFELERGRILSTPAAQQLGGRQQLWYKDYGLGFMVNTPWFYAGFSADNMNQHYENVYNQEGYATPTSTPVALSGIIGTDYDFKRRPKDKPMTLSSFVAYQKFGDRQELWAGLNFRLNAFTIGGSVSQNLDYSGRIGMKFEKFKLFYQYDQTTSTLSDKQIASHNIGIRFNGSTKKPRLK